MKREYAEIPLNGGPNPPVKVTVTYTSKDCMPTSRLEQFDLLRTVIENPGLLDCGPVSFQTLKMYHNGTAWVIVLEATNVTK